MGDESRLNHEVFISYSKKDKKLADAACAVLERHWIRCWIAPRDVTPGTEWQAAIISGLNASKIMVLIFSTHANQSAQVRREVERAIGKGLIVLPFRVEDVSPAGAMEYALSNTHWLDGFTPPLERHLDALAGSVKSLLGKEYDQHTRSTGPGTEPPPPLLNLSQAARSRLLIAVGVVVLTVFIAVGSFLMFRNRTVRPIAETALVRDNTPQPIAESAHQSDQERIQGRWQAVTMATSKATREDDPSLRLAWEFQGTQLTIHWPKADWHGSFSLGTGVERKLFDYSGAGPGGDRFELLGIYEFESQFLRVCSNYRTHQNGPKFKRPDSFVVNPKSPYTYVKLRRLSTR